MKLTLFVILLSITGILFAGPVMAEKKCMTCHGKKDLVRAEVTGRQVSLFVDEDLLARSMHAEKKCTECHIDIVEIPHPKKVEKVNCRRCHYSGNPVGAPGGINDDKYGLSVHGQEVANGNPKAPVCQDCHGTHDIISHDSTDSKIHLPNIPKTCGSCHIEIYATYNASVHGVAVNEGNSDSPVCTSCHGEHSIKRTHSEESTVSALNVTATCTEKCHNPLGVASKYGIKTDRAATFEDSFHGMAQMMANKTVANCASCHGFHDIRTSDDPQSSIHKDNITKTCGKIGCHPEASFEFASGTIHVDPKNEESGLLYYISKGFMILTVSTLTGLFLFILLDLFRRAKRARQKR